MIGRNLGKYGYQCAVYYPVPIHLQDAYKFLGYKEGDFPVAERVCKEILALPMKGVTEKDVVNICSIIKESV
jgi:dTDP-4-amino-4,6-dideoxygalactose transaminase